MELEQKYPVGSVVQVNKDGKEFHARVTGHGEITQEYINGKPMYAKSALGPRIQVSTNPIGMENVDNNNLNKSIATNAKPESIK